MNNKIEGILSKKNYNFEDLVVIVSILRGEGGCPWDIEQTHKSIRDDLIEETYEVIEAIDTDDSALLREELGDVLLQIVFHSGIETDAGVFTIDDVCDEICKKMIVRHPHVFGDTVVKNTSDVLKNWESIKSNEKQRNTVTDKLNAIPKQLPALMRATKVGSKASCFDFADTDSVISKLDEEVSELKTAISHNDRDNVYEEIGDLLLTVTSLCRKLDINAERALNDATTKFINRFEKVETECIKSGRNIKNVQMSELDEIWEQIKHKF